MPKIKVKPVSIKRLKKNPKRRSSSVAVAPRKKRRKLKKSRIVKSVRKVLRRKRRAPKAKIIRAKKNPYIPYLIYGDLREINLPYLQYGDARKGKNKNRYYWNGERFTTDKKFAEHFANAESAYNAAKRLQTRLPYALAFVAVQRVS
jgi:hypothetical protein